MSHPANDPRDHATDPWAAHREAQLDAWSATTPVERLRWLEQALAFAYRAGAVRRPGAEPPTAR